MKDTLEKAQKQGGAQPIDSFFAAKKSAGRGSTRTRARRASPWPPRRPSAARTAGPFGRHPGPCRATPRRPASAPPVGAPPRPRPRPTRFQSARNSSKPDRAGGAPFSSANDHDRTAPPPPPATSIITPVDSQGDITYGDVFSLGAKNKYILLNRL